MAGAQLVETVELLETILLQLPAKDLLLAQRVNKQFKGTIDNSNHIQRALFYKVDPYLTETPGSIPQELNPFLFQLRHIDTAPYHGPGAPPTLAEKKQTQRCRFTVGLPPDKGPVMPFDVNFLFPCPTRQPDTKPYG